MACGLRPSASPARGFHGVADVLAVADARMAQQLAAPRIYRLRIAAIGPYLLAADIQRGRTVEAGRVDGVRLWRGVEGAGGLQRDFGLEVGHEALPPTLAPVAAFAQAAKGRCGVEE